MSSLPAVILLLLVMLASGHAFAGNPTAEAPISTAEYSVAAKSEPIQDNSFLIEEAYNQEDGVVQHITYMQRSFATRDWVYTQTDEWPVRTIKHQLSLTMAGAHSGALGGLGVGDTAINYRYQLLGDGNAKLAIAPRLSVLGPTGNARLGRGNGSWGLQTNFPVSVQHNRFLVTHWNVGATWLPTARNFSGEQAKALNVNLGQSTVWLVSPRFNALLETIWTSTAQVVASNFTERKQDLYVSPGIRWAHNFRSGLQIVPGIGAPIGVGPSAGQKGLIAYLSFEHPWSVAHSRQR